MLVSHNSCLTILNNNYSSETQAKEIGLPWSTAKIFPPKCLKMHSLLTCCTPVPFWICLLLIDLSSVIDLFIHGIQTFGIQQMSFWRILSQNPCPLWSSSLLSLVRGWCVQSPPRFLALCLLCSGQLAILHKLISHPKFAFSLPL